MKAEPFFIGRVPAVLYGEKSEDLFLFVHGLGGSHEEGARFAEVACPLGYRVLAVDLPQHGGRRDGRPLVPWVAVPELQEVFRYAAERYARLSVRAISIGAWLSLVAFSGCRVEKCLFSSPLLDMERMILSMMQAAGVSEQRLSAEREIPVPGGQTLSWEYLCWVREHPASALCPNTALLRATGDEMIPRDTVTDFAVRNAARLTEYPGGQHWLHTPEEMTAMAAWEREELTRAGTASL